MVWRLSDRIAERRAVRKPRMDANKEQLFVSIPGYFIFARGEA
jgi:hypothetical protein